MIIIIMIDYSVDPAHGRMCIWHSRKSTALVSCFGRSEKEEGHSRGGAAAAGFFRP